MCHTFNNNLFSVCKSFRDVAVIMHNPDLSFEGFDTS